MPWVILWWCHIGVGNPMASEHCLVCHLLPASRIRNCSCHGQTHYAKWHSTLVPKYAMQNQPMAMCPMCQCKVNQWPVSNVPAQHKTSNGQSQICQCNAKSTNGHRPMCQCKVNQQCIGSAHAIRLTVALQMETTAATLHAQS